MRVHQRHGPIAVIDVETTGLFPFRHDRVVEIAVVVVDEDGAVAREFETLVNPGRDIGPTSIHGLCAEDVSHAPSFADVAGALVDAMGGAVAIAAHNVRFDRQFLEREFDRIDATLPDLPALCTMQLAGGGKLAACCECYDVAFDGAAHHALADARAAAGLLARLLPDAGGLLADLGRSGPIGWPAIASLRVPGVPRSEARRRRLEPPSYLRRLLERVHVGGALAADDGAAMAYAATLDRMLEDRVIDPAEADALVELAGTLGLAGPAIAECHRDYLNALAVAALADGVVTDAERRDLELVARVLGQDEARLHASLEAAREALLSNAAPNPVARGVADDGSLHGKRVCFTGELQCTIGGEPIPRERAEAMAVRAGCEVADSVTKKLDVLVLADPHSQSGKAKKARSYGVRILHEPLFWRAIDVDVD